MSVVRLGWSPQMSAAEQRRWLDEARGVLDAHRVRTPGTPKRTAGPVGQAALALEQATREAELAVRTIERLLAHLERCLQRVETQRALLDAMGGGALRRERERLGLSQRAAAQLAGMSRGYLDDLESGVGPEGEGASRHREKIAAALAAYAQTTEEPQP